MKFDELHIKSLIHTLKQFGDVIFLESQKKDHPSSEYSYLAAKPIKTMHGYGHLNYLHTGDEVTVFQKNPWLALKEFQQTEEEWLFGYFGYDLKNESERLISNNPSFSSLPDYYFMIPELLIEINQSGEITILRGELPNPSELEHNHHLLDVINQISITKNEYLDSVELAKKNIYEGNIYELNYTYTQRYDFIGSAINLYEAMRTVGPVPFGAYLKIYDTEVCCASPERFLKRDGNIVISQPIKGTVSNTDSSNLDELKNEKNKAENLMIVDLVRNDLNRIAIAGSVKVNRLFEIQTFNTVHQLVSTIECEVNTTTNSVDIIKHCFPMGSMTGAPKIAAMKAIEQLENYKRGLYSGAIGYFKPNGDFDFNVVIRTAIIENKKLIYPVGGAITSDSAPKEEWNETIIKTQALKKAVKK